MAIINRDISYIDMVGHHDEYDIDGYNNSDANKYTIKYDTKLKRFFKQFTPKVASGGMISAGIFTVLGAAALVAGPVLGLTAGLIAGASAGLGAVVQATYNTALYASELSKTNFNKHGLGGTEESAEALQQMKGYQKALESSRKRIIELESGERVTRRELKKRIKELNTRVGSIDIVRDSARTAYIASRALENSPNTDKIEIEGVKYSRRKIQRIVNENENIAYHGLNYLLDQGLRVSDRINRLSDKPKNKYETAQFEGFKGIIKKIADCTSELATERNRTIQTSKKNAKSEGIYNPYKNLIVNSIFKGCLLGNDKQNKTIRKIAKENNKTLAFAQYSSMYEQPVLERLSMERDEQIAATEQINNDIKRGVANAISLQGKDFKLGRLTKEQRRISGNIQNEIDYEASIKVAKEIKKHVSEEDSKKIDTAIKNLQIARINGNEEYLNTTKNALDALIQEMMPKLNARKYYNKGLGVALKKYEEINRQKRAEFTQNFRNNLLKQHEAHKNDTSRRVEPKNTKLNAAQEDILRLQNEKSELEIKLQTAILSAGESSKTVTKLRTQLSQKETELAEAIKTNTELTNQNSTSQEEILKLQAEKEALERKLQGVIKDAGKKKVQIARLLDQRTGLQIERSNLTKRETEILDEVENLKTKIGNIDLKLNQALASNTTLSKRNEEQKGLIFKMGQQSEEYKKALELSQQKLASAQEDNANLQKENETLRRKFKGAVLSAGQKKKQIEELEDQRTGLQIERRGLRQREALSAEEIARLGGQVESLEIQLDRSDALNAAQSEVILGLTEGVEGLQTKLKSERGANSRLRGAAKKQETEHQRIIDEKNTIISQQSATISEQGEIIKKQGQETSRLREENYDMSDRLEDALRANGENLDYIAELRVVNERVETSNRQLSSTNENLLIQNQGLVRALTESEQKRLDDTKKLSIDLHNAEQRIEELSGDLDSTRSEAESLRDLGLQDYNFRFGREKQLLYDLIDKINAHIEHTKETVDGYNEESVGMLTRYVEEVLTYDLNSKTVEALKADVELLRARYEAHISDLSKLSDKKLREIIQQYREDGYGMKR